MWNVTRGVGPCGRLATAIALACTVPAAAQQPAAGGEQALNQKLPRIETSATAGFRLYRAGYRLAGQGILVSVQLCRIPGWAAAGPHRLRVELTGSDGNISEGVQVYLPRLGMRAGNNCIYSSVHMKAPPNYGEIIKICTLSGGKACP